MYRYLNDKIKEGIIWITSGYIIIRVLSFIVNIIFARLLIPNEFGLFAQAFVIVFIFWEVSPFGVDTFIVYKQEEYKKYIGSAFTLSLISNIFIFIFILILSLIISNIYTLEFSNIRIIKHIIIILSLLYLIQPLRAISLGVLNLEMQFDKITKANIISFITACVISVIIAIAGGRIWALVFYNFIERFLSVFILMYYSKIKVAFHFDLIKIKEIAKYGLYITASTFVWYIIMNMDIFMIGKYLGSYSAGIYSFSMKQAVILITTIGFITGKITFPTFAKMQGDNIYLKKAFIKTTQIVTLIGIPLSVILFITAPQFIIYIFGEKWAASIIPFRILIVGLSARLLFGHVPQLLRAIGRTDLDFIYGLIILPIFFVAILMSIKYGIEAVSYTVSFIYCISSIITGLYSAKLIGIKIRDFLKV